MFPLGIFTHFLLVVTVGGSHDEEKKPKLSQEEYEKKLLNGVTPLWQMSYTDQLQVPFFSLAASAHSAP